MSINRRKPLAFLTTAMSMLVSIVLLSGCSGSGGEDSDQTAGIGGTGIVAGEITGFGSVYVNGGKFNIDNSQFNVDDDTNADQSDLSLGMIVKLRVETRDGVFTNKAIEIEYDDEIEGPVSAVSAAVGTTRTFMVFGQTITIDETTTVFKNTSFVDIENNDVVEVSGFRASDTQINATYVEETAEDVVFNSTEVELRGIIGSYSSGPPEMFIVDGITINTDGFTEIDVSGPLQDGLYVEVKGKIQTATSILASKIEEEDEDFEEDIDDISLQGLVAGFVNISSDFFIGSQRVNASTAQLSPSSLSLVNGLNIEVEGKIIGGTLIADEVEARDGDTKLGSHIGLVNVAGGSFQVTYPTAIAGVVIVRIDGRTLFEDDTGPLLTAPFSLDDLIESTDFVRVEGREVGGEVIATVVKRKNGVGEDLKLEGSVDSFVPDTSITILGITYGVDPTPGGTDFDGFASSAAFFATLNPAGGDVVEIVDEDAADGVADEVELE